MTIATWPGFLQDFVNEDSFSSEMGDTVLRSENDVGPAKVRRISTRPIDTYTVTINVYQTDMISFKQFFNTALNGGVTPFYFDDPITGVKEVFRFTKPPSISPIGSAGHWRISMNWEKLP